MKIKLCIAWLCLLFPAIGLACKGTGFNRCEKQFDRLLEYRKEAILTAFGDLSATLPRDLQVKFFTKKDPEHARFNGAAMYDAEQHVLFFPRDFLLLKVPDPLEFLVYYWPYYQEAYFRTEYPVVEAIDNILWSMYLQEAAQVRGLSWPHKDCTSFEVGKRLPCEMLATGIAEFAKHRRMPIFNTNRLDRIWPQDFARFSARIGRDDLEYREVQRYGGILLVAPLIGEFGVGRTFAYVAQTPFEIEADDLRGSVQRYQERARKALVW